MDSFVRGMWFSCDFVSLLVSARLNFRFLGTEIFSKKKFFTTLDFSPSPVTFEDVKRVTKSPRSRAQGGNLIRELFDGQRSKYTCPTIKQTDYVR